MVAIKAIVFTSKRPLLYPVTLSFCVLCFRSHGVSLFFQRNASFGRQSLQLLLSFVVCAVVQSFDLWIVFGALVHKLPHLLLFKVWYLPGKVLFFHPVLVLMFDPIFAFVCQAMEPSNLINRMAWIASASSAKSFWAWKWLISRSPLMSCRYSDRRAFGIAYSHSSFHCATLRHWSEAASAFHGFQRQAQSAWGWRGDGSMHRQWNPGSLALFCIHARCRVSQQNKVSIRLDYFAGKSYDNPNRDSDEDCFLKLRTLPGVFLELDLWTKATHSINDPLICSVVVSSRANTPTVVRKETGWLATTKLRSVRTFSC